jgi:hypothetical protein
VVVPVVPVVVASVVVDVGSSVVLVEVEAVTPLEEVSPPEEVPVEAVVAVVAEVDEVVEPESSPAHPPMPMPKVPARMSSFTGESER